jgi:hypothetical protein
LKLGGNGNQVAELLRLSLGSGDLGHDLLDGAACRSSHSLKTCRFWLLSGQSSRRNARFANKWRHNPTMARHLKNRQLHGARLGSRAAHAAPAKGDFGSHHDWVFDQPIRLPIRARSQSTGAFLRSPQDMKRRPTHSGGPSHRLPMESAQRRCSVAKPAFLDSRIRWRECFLALSSATCSSPRRETALRRRRGEGCVARLTGRLAAIGW